MGTKKEKCLNCKFKKCFFANFAHLHLFIFSYPCDHTTSPVPVTFENVSGFSGLLRHEFNLSKQKKDILFCLVVSSGRT